MVVQIKNATKLCHEKYFCIVYNICEEIHTQMPLTKVLLHGKSSKTEHPYVRTSQYMLKAERQLLESNKPHKVRNIRRFGGRSSSLHNIISVRRATKLEANSKWKIFDSKESKSK